MKMATKDELEIALKESLILQSHYAKILNKYDGGERRIFKSPKEWIARLREIGKLNRKKVTQEKPNGKN
jgi:hypothetical protein